MAAEAVHELEEWGTLPVPNWPSHSFRHQLLFLLLSAARGCYWCGSDRWCFWGAFWSAFIRLGGESRINMLLTIARFDGDFSGELSADELANYKVTGEQLVATTNAGFGNLALVFVLIFGATHQTTESLKRIQAETLTCLCSCRASNLCWLCCLGCAAVD